MECQEVVMMMNFRKNFLFFQINCTFFRWGKNPDRPFLNKHSYVVHAEENAILNAKDSLKGNILYSTHFPCNKCAKMIIQVCTFHFI